MEFDLNTMENYGFAFYDDVFNDTVLKNLADMASEHDDIQLPALVSVSLVEKSTEDRTLQNICESTSEAIESNDSPPSSDSSLNSCKDQLGDQTSPSVSPKSSETSMTTSTDVLTLSLDEMNKDTTIIDSFKKRGRKVALPRGEVIPGEFYCPNCKKNFRSQRGLRQHHSSHHTGVKAHSCDICGKRFDLLHDMKKHRERHSEENKPFGCSADGCSKRFMYVYDMERHVTFRHGEAPYSCDICSKVFVRLDHLEKHKLCHEYNTVKKNKRDMQKKTF